MDPLRDNTYADFIVRMDKEYQESQFTIEKISQKLLAQDIVNKYRNFSIISGIYH